MATENDSGEISVTQEGVIQSSTALDEWYLELEIFKIAITAKSGPDDPGPG